MDARRTFAAQTAILFTMEHPEASNCRCQVSWLERAWLWMITDVAAARGRALPKLVADGIRGGVDVVVVRLKELGRNALIAQARAIAEVCREHSTPWILSHAVELVGELMPDGVHLGKSDSPVNDVRRMLGERVVIGYSAHTLDELAFNAELGADYCFYSPIFPARKGDVTLDGLGLDAVTHALAAGVAVGKNGCPFPIVFLGGITLENMGAIVACGAKRVAAIGALIGAEDVEDAAREFKRLMGTS
jgi:thiamine-phosphate pyrophosphorylase